MDTFLSWREKFRAEMAETKKLPGAAAKDKKDSRKLTGKWLIICM